jgi:hypothetical protein
MSMILFIGFFISILILAAIPLVSRHMDGRRLGTPFFETKNNRPGPMTAIILRWPLNGGALPPAQPKGPPLRVRQPGVWNTLCTPPLHFV